MNLKKVILLYNMKSILCNSNTAYINELEKSNTFFFRITIKRRWKYD